MLADELSFQITKELRLTPTREQAAAISVFTRFLTDRETEGNAFLRGSVMILRGSAGTGKTTLASAIVRTMIRLRQRVVLMAPTGRAAKVFSLNAGQPAYTIHRRIYRQQSLEGGFTLGFNAAADTLFFVDEASMISTQPSTSSLLPTSLLDDLVSFVYGGQNCRMILIGDMAQLPPVGEQESPALSADVLRSFYLNVYECDLNEVLRQAQDSGILWNATNIREKSLGMSRETTGIDGECITLLPQIRFQGFADIVMVPGDELIESLASSYSRVGTDETMVVTRSNKRANAYNLGIRNTILGREEELTTSDRLMVVKNKYLKNENKNENENGNINGYGFREAPERIAKNENINGGEAGKSLSFIANGDMAVVQRVRNVRSFYGFRFADVTIQFPDYDHEELTTTVILDTLQTEAPALTKEQQQQLFTNVMEDYAYLPSKKERLKMLKEDIYYNALQIKYGYAVTCHKAQGGQWAHVYIDQGYMTDEMLTPDYIHWLYTAFTRATERLFLVNWPKNQVRL